LTSAPCCATLPIETADVPNVLDVGWWALEPTVPDMALFSIKRQSKWVNSFESKSRANRLGHSQIGAFLLHLTINAPFATIIMESVIDHPARAIVARCLGVYRFFLLP